MQDGPWTGLSPGLAPLHPQDWLEIDQHYEEEIEEKRQLLQMKPAETFSVLPDVNAKSPSDDLIMGLHTS